MPAFDINAILSAALATAVAEAIAPLMECIRKLEAQSADRHQRLLALEGALTDRVVALEGDISHEVQVQQANITAALAERIAVLENNPAQGVEPPVGIAEALNSQEWFWEKLTRKAREVAEAVAEQSMDNHLECYDHDNYDEIASKVEDIDFDDLVKTDDLSDSVREAVQGLSFEVRVS